MDLDCGVTHKGCINMPNCEEILKRVGGRYGNGAEDLLYCAVVPQHELGLGSDGRKFSRCHWLT